MPYIAPSFETIRQRALRELRSQESDADITSDSDNYIRLSSVAAVAEGIHQQAAWTARQIFADSADFDELKKHAAPLGIVLKSATAASSGVSVSGAAGKPVAAGLQIRHVASGLLLNTTTATTISSAGAGRVSVAADEAGTAYNSLEGAAIFVSPPLGVDSACVLEALTGGTEDETQESLLSRYLDAVRNPPSGGNVADYRRWALSVSGVSTVMVLPRRRGGNSVDVVITSAGVPSSPEIIAATQAYIETQYPVGADLWVYTPAVITVAVVASLKLEPGYTIDDLQSPMEVACAGVFDSLVPLETLYRLRLTAALGGLSGVVDLELTSPVGNVSASTDPGQVSWIRLGSVSLVPLV